MNVPNRICSNKSHELVQNFLHQKFANQIEAGRSLFSFFGLYTGEKEFWDLLEMILTQKEIDSNNKIHHINDIVRAYYSKILQLETAGPFSFLGTALAKKEDKLAECAKMYLKLGDVKQYCEIMISLNQWEKAIALAPCISITYWQECVDRYTQALKESSDENLLEYQLLANDKQGAIDILLEKEEYEDAKLLKILFESGVFFDVSKCYESKDRAKKDPLNAHIENIAPEFRKNITDICHLEAEQYFAKGEVLLSAAVELAIGNNTEAIIKLIRANELLLAYFVAGVLKVPVLDQINYLLALKAEKINDVNLAFYYYKNSRNIRNARLYAVRAKVDGSNFGVKPIGDYVKLAKEATGADAVYYHILSENLEQAANITIEFTQKVLDEKKYELLGKVIEMHSLMQSVPIVELTREMKIKLLYYASFIGFFRAMWLGFVNVIGILIKNCHNIENFNKISHGISLNPLEDLGFKLIKSINEGNVNRLEELVEDMEDVKVKELTKAMLRAIRTNYNSGISFVRNRISSVWYMWCLL